MSNNINDIDIEYEIVIKKQDDILFEITNDLRERLIYESIINGLESYAAETIKTNKIAQLPLIGSIRKNPIRQVVRDNYNNFKIARKNMTTSQYKEHVREIIIDAKQNLEREERDKRIIKLTRSKNKKHYDKLYKSIGRHYAELYIQSLLWLKEVPYILEVQEQYDKLNNL